MALESIIRVLYVDHFKSIPQSLCYCSKNSVKAYSYFVLASHLPDQTNRWR